jgi:lipopolysaccharide/colanic/teichoic acid biosynthesis glycosyltransferase
MTAMDWIVQPPTGPVAVLGGARPVVDVEAAVEAWMPSKRWDSRFHRLAKRSLDFLAAALALLLLAPLMAIVAALVWRTSPGPILLRQTRIGKDGVPFRMYKFRTMVADSDPALHRAYIRSLVRGQARAHGGAFKLTDDPRITRVGRFLRRLSLDELPQLYNVIRGEMSLVGPRPPLPYEVELYDTRARRRLTVTPGMTGLWQVSGRSRLDFQQMIELDLAYIARWSIWLDLSILCRTPAAVLATSSAR